MITVLTVDEYYTYFPQPPHCFLSREFVVLHQHKVDRLVFLMSQCGRIGLVAGIKERILKSPFSAPIGGFHTVSPLVSSESLTLFYEDIIEFCHAEKLSSVSLTIPPEWYGNSVHGKALSAAIRTGFRMEIPEINNWFDLSRYDGTYPVRHVAKNIRHAKAEQVRFEEISDHGRKKECFSLISENRKQFGRPIYLTFDDICAVSAVLPIRFFACIDQHETVVAAAVIYYSGNHTIHAIFWADSETGRPLRAMDLLVDSLWKVHHNEGFHWADIGISTENGVPNDGLIHFKESHGCCSSPRFTVTRSFNE